MDSHQASVIRATLQCNAAVRKRTPGRELTVQDVAQGIRRRVRIRAGLQETTVIVPSVCSDARLQSVAMPDYRMLGQLQGWVGVPSSSDLRPNPASLSFAN